MILCIQRILRDRLGFNVWGGNDLRVVYDRPKQSSVARDDSASQLVQITPVPFINSIAKVLA